MRKIDLTGKRFGRLTVTGEYKGPKKIKTILWACVCDCGKEVLKRGECLRRGDTKSCGCLHKQKVTKHGYNGTSEYTTWSAMIERCHNPKKSSFAYYGAKGISVCEAWRESFKSFITDMGKKPTERHSLERIDGKGNYEPDNCVWIESEKQSRNLRKMKTNTSGVTGVHFLTNQNTWSAQWFDLDRKRVSRTFSVNKYGHGEAFRLACDARERAIQELNSRGAGYSDAHGK